MARSLQLKPDCIPTVKAAVKAQGYSRQKDLADELGICLATLSSFLNGKRVDMAYFQSICQRLELDWKAIAESSWVNHETSQDPSSPEDAAPEPVVLNGVSKDSATRPDLAREPWESLCIHALQQAGGLVRIRGSGLTGKTVLGMRLLQRLESQDYQAAYLNFHFASQSEFASLERFLKWFCAALGQSLGLQNQLAHYWDADFSTEKVNCTEYLAQYLLPQIGKPLVLCLDEVDRLFPYPIVAAEFLGLLRGWHELAKMQPIWQNFRLILIHSTEVYVQIDIHSSPFNVGLPITLPAFDRPQVQQRVTQYHLNLSDEQIDAILTLLGGHPYLLEQLLMTLQVNPARYDEVMAIAATEAGIYGHHLRHIWRMVAPYPELMGSLRTVMMASQPIRIPSEQARQLESLGVIHRQGNEVLPSCDLYRHYILARGQDAELGRSPGGQA